MSSSHQVIKRQFSKKKNIFSFRFFSVLQADASLGMLEREYLRESLSYVLGIQDVQERIKFEFVETLLGFMSGWLLFYHLGHEAGEDSKEYMTDLQHKVQKVRHLCVSFFKINFLFCFLKPDFDEFR